MPRGIGSGIFGRTTAERYQLTPVGAGRLQSGNLPKMSPATKGVLAGLGRLGGIADDDELALQTNTNPGTLHVCLKRLVDMGLVVPVAPPRAPTPTGR